MTTKELVYKPATSLPLPTLRLTGCSSCCAPREEGLPNAGARAHQRDLLAQQLPQPIASLFHRCSLALTAEQAEHVLATGTLLRSWFGDGRSVPVKNSL